MNIPETSAGLAQLVAIFRTLQAGQPKFQQIEVVRDEVSFEDAKETFDTQVSLWIENLILAGHALRDFNPDVTLRATGSRGGQADGNGNYWFRNLTGESSRAVDASKTIITEFGGRKTVGALAESFLTNAKTERVEV